jgi:hypothetical protein
VYRGIHVKYPLFLSDFNETWIFSTYFRKESEIPNFMKIRQVEAQSFHAGGGGGEREWQTDITKLTVAFRNLANAPKNADHHIPTKGRLYCLRSYSTGGLKTCRNSKIISRTPTESTVSLRRIANNCQKRTVTNISPQRLPACTDTTRSTSQFNPLTHLCSVPVSVNKYYCHLLAGVSFSAM